MEQLNISCDDNILIIAPHPDDECIGAGGVLLAHSEKCDVLVLTDGRQGQGVIASELEKEIRKTEFIAEMKSINVRDYKMLDIEDGTLLAHLDCLDDYNMTQYTKIFVTGEFDEHPDHKAAFLCVKNALKEQKEVPEIYVYEVHTPIQGPSHFTDITNSINEKVRLVRFHESQIKELPYDKLVQENAAYRATLFRMPSKKIEVYKMIDISENANNSDISTNLLLQKERVNNWVLKSWLKSSLKSKELFSLLRQKKINGVYIYGYGELGKILLEYLELNNFDVKAVIDRRATQFSSEMIPVIQIEEADMTVPVIVTAIFDYDNINTQLLKAGFHDIYSLRTLIEELEV